MLSLCLLLSTLLHAAVALNLELLARLLCLFPTPALSHSPSAHAGKHFALPAAWKGSSVWVYIEGSFHITNAYLNGKHLGEHAAGYTSFWLRLDDAGANWGSENVLALHVNATTGTGWWYEGGGLMRHQHLIKTSAFHIAPDGAWAHANVTGGPRNRQQLCQSADKPHPLRD